MDAAVDADAIQRFWTPNGLDDVWLRIKWIKTADIGK